MELGKRIAEARKSLNKTQRAFSEESGIGLATLQRYESGKRTPNIETLENIADALETTIEKLLRNDESLKFGSNLRKIRKELKKTRKDLSDVSGITVESLRAFEIGTKAPHPNDVKALKLSLGLKDIGMYKDGWTYDSCYNHKNASHELDKIINERKKLESTNSEKGLGEGLVKLFPDLATIVEKDYDTDENEKMIIYWVGQLNDQGQTKALELLQLLTTIPEYKKAP